VVVTIPTCGAEFRSFIVGENLFDFLCLGMYRGFFCLEELAHNSKQTLQACLDPLWEPSEERDYAMGFGVDEHNAQLLALLVERLELSPWQSPTHFDDLQKQYERMLEFPADFPRYTDENPNKAASRDKGRITGSSGQRRPSGPRT
jgi:hypothetical protein